MMGNSFKLSLSISVLFFRCLSLAKSDCTDLCIKQLEKADIDLSSRTAYIGKCSSLCKSSDLDYRNLKEKHSTPSASTSDDAEYNELPGTMGGSGPDDNYDPKTDPYDKKFSGQGNASQGSGSSPSNIADDAPTAKIPDTAAANSEAASGSSTNNSEVSSTEPETKQAASTESPIDLCEKAHDQAMRDCNPESQGWMKNIQMAAQGLGPVLESGACGKLAAANVGASTSLSTFKIMCNTATQACVSACTFNAKSPVFFEFPKSIENAINNSNQRLKECRAKGVKAAEAEQAAAQGTQQLLAAVQTCKTAFGVNANPFDIKNDPYQGKTAEEIMAGLQPSQGSGSLEYSGTQGSTAGTGNSNLDLSGLDTENEKGFKPKPGSGGPGSPVGGSMGSAGMGGGGGSGVDAGGGGGNGGKKPSGGLLANILSGFFGGGGGGGLFGGTGRGKGGGLSGFFGGEKPQAAAKTPDLRQFMPGGRMDPRKERGLAGQRLNADGMSGPHGNIWRMINNRYQYKKASLLP